VSAEVLSDMLPTDTLQTLASLTFDKIGSLREDSRGRFFVAEYVDPNTTAFPEERAMVFKNLESRYRGPFSTVSEFYHASCLLGKAHARTDPEGNDELPPTNQQAAAAQTCSKECGVPSFTFEKSSFF